MSQFLTPLAAGLPATVPFTGPEALERASGLSFRARLGANESGFGPSPRVIAALERAAREVWMYGDPEAYELRAAIAGLHGLSPAHVRLGEGIDGLLGLLVRLTVAPGDVVVTSDGAYPTFNFHVTGHGGVLHKVAYRDDASDLEALADLAQRLRPKLVYMANPDNPMGSHHSGAAVMAFLEALPAGTLLVLDEAYVDLAPDGTAAPVAADDPRVIRMRTFSKAHGLAGLRVGYALGEPGLIAAFDRVRNHFGLGRMAQAGALAAVQDPDWLDRVRAEIAVARVRFAAIARENGLVPLPSATNFLTVDCGRDGAYARRVLAEAQARGLFIRMPGVAPLDRCIRISLGDGAAAAVVAEVLPQALAAAR